MLDHVGRVSGLPLLWRKQIRRKRARNIKLSGSKADFSMLPIVKCLQSHIPYLTSLTMTHLIPECTKPQQPKLTHMLSKGKHIQATHHATQNGVQRTRRRSRHRSSSYRSFIFTFNYHPRQGHPIFISRHHTPSPHTIPHQRPVHQPLRSRYRTPLQISPWRSIPGYRVPHQALAMAHRRTELLRFLNLLGRQDSSLKPNPSR